MRWLAVLLLMALATGCPSGGQGGTVPGVTAPTTGPSAGIAMPIDLTVPPTVVFVDLFDQVVPVGCWSPGTGLHASADGCAELLDRDRTVASFAGVNRPLGEPVRNTCEATGESYPAFRVDTPPAPSLTATGDQLEGLVVWPPGRAPALIGWTHPTLAPDDPAADLGADLRGLLIADLDGDRTLDRLFSLNTRVVIGELSSRPGERVTLWESDFEDLAAFVAIDLDGDGRVEVLIGAPYADGDSVTVTRYLDGALVAVSGWGCGP